MGEEYIGMDVDDTELTSWYLSGEAEENNEKSQSESPFFISSLDPESPECGDGMLSTLQRGSLSSAATAGTTILATTV
jgi:hypothetical protein